VSPARQAAFRILLRVSRQDAYAAELLHSPLAASLDDKDLRLTTELVFGVLRQQQLLDHLLSPHSRTSLSRLDPEVIIALRLGVYQLIFLDRIPARAAVHESVDLVRSAKLKSAVPFVNAVLRKVRRSDLEACLGTPETDTATALSLRYSHPQWLVERWARQFGDARLVELLKHNNRPPPVYFRINSPDLSRDKLLTALNQQGIVVKLHPLSDDIFELLEGDLHQTLLFRDRKVAVQDAGSQLLPRLLDLRPSDVCLDLCAGPGGKASQAARLKGSTTPVLAIDLHWHRLRVARELHSGQWRNVHWVVADGTQPLPFRRSFDKILVDVPCSGTGTLQRHPELRWRLKPEALPALASLQRSLLESAVQYPKPEGTLVYSTCSLEPEENETVVAGFLSSHPEVHQVLPEDPMLRRLFDSQKFLRLFPPASRTDGFFAVVIKKR
jgi:16S rRNA (cytosine967-C5)-methyltransferase